MGLQLGDDSNKGEKYTDIESTCSLNDRVQTMSILTKSKKQNPCIIWQMYASQQSDIGNDINDWLTHRILNKMTEDIAYSIFPGIFLTKKVLGGNCAEVWALRSSVQHGSNTWSNDGPVHEHMYVSLGLDANPIKSCMTNITLSLSLDLELSSAIIP